MSWINNFDEIMCVSVFAEYNMKSMSLVYRRHQLYGAIINSVKRSKNILCTILFVYKLFFFKNMSCRNKYKMCSLANQSLG